MFGSIKKSRIFASLFRNKIIELWCNGNTADFGSVILGSNPGSSTPKTPKVILECLFFDTYTT